MWPTDYYLAGHQIKERQIVEPDDESFCDIIPEVGMMFKSQEKYYRVVLLRRWHSESYTGYVRAIDVLEAEKMSKQKKVEKTGCEACICFKQCQSILKGGSDVCHCTCLVNNCKQEKQGKRGRVCSSCESLTCPEISKRPCKQTKVDVSRRKYIETLGKNPDICFPKGELITGTQEKLF